MTSRTVAAIVVCFLAALSTVCSPATRHKVLSAMFDGVPPLAPPVPAGGEKPVGESGVVHAGAGGLVEHGPYAARLCNACHDAGATNALVAPPDRLCFRCHDLGSGKTYVHGPIASGGCLVCHDPHSSPNRYLLVSASDSFCLHCHDREAVAGIGAHHGLEENCTICHDAHMSDKKYLLR